MLHPTACKPSSYFLVNPNQIIPTMRACIDSETSQDAVGLIAF